MLCVNAACGRPLKDGAMFCPFCATRQEQPTPAAESATPPPPRQDPARPAVNVQAAASGDDGSWRTSQGPSRAQSPSRPHQDPRAVSNVSEVPPQEFEFTPPVTSISSMPAVPPQNSHPHATSLSAPTPAAASPVPAEHVLLRARKEDEIPVAPGLRRPMVVLREEHQTFVITTQLLSADRILRNVKDFVTAQRVPVDTRVVKAWWQNDQSDIRERVMVSLIGHRYSDIKMLVGVDYMGNWASVHYLIAVEPPPYPVPPDTPSEPVSESSSRYGLIIMGIGVILWMMASASNSSPLSATGGLVFVSGILILIYEASSTNSAHQRALQEWRADCDRIHREWELRHIQQAQENQRLRAARTFKDDDVRLFTECMDTIFRVIVSDIEKDLGGRLVKVNAIPEENHESVALAPTPSVTPQPAQSSYAQRPPQRPTADPGI